MVFSDFSSIVCCCYLDFLLMRITKVTTRTGDAGQTGLGNGERVSKNSLRVNLKHIWIAFAIPNENLLFDQQVLRCELVELTSIANHKHKFNNEAPLSDLKYADKNQKEIVDLIDADMFSGYHIFFAGKICLVA